MDAATERDRVSSFGGMCGRALGQSFGVESLINGLVVGFVLALGVVPLTRFGAAGLASLHAELVVALVLARFVLNGRAGEWGGTLFSTRGGPPEAAGPVALRYLCLCALWMAPLVLLGLKPGSFVAAPGKLPPALQDGKVLALLVIYAFASVVTPALFLIVASLAEKLSDLFRADLWRRVLGRREELLTLHAVWLGATLVGLLLAVPAVLVSALLRSPGFSGVVAALELCFVGGVALNLLGRLSGLLAALVADEPRPAPPRPRATGAPAPPRAARREPVRPPPSAPVLAPSVVAPVILAAAPLATGAGSRPLLLDARERVDAAFARFAADPAGAIGELEELRRSKSPHPLVLHALTCMLARSGREPAAVALGREALPLCLKRGHLQLAADVVIELSRRAADLGLDRDQLIQIATALYDRRDLQHAANAFALVIQANPGDPRAVQGLLQVADTALHEGAAADALRLYRYLLQHCAGTPLADDIHRGEAAAEKLLVGR